MFPVLPSSASLRWKAHCPSSALVHLVSQICSDVFCSFYCFFPPDVFLHWDSLCHCPTARNEGSLALDWLTSRRMRMTNDIFLPIHLMVNVFQIPFEIFAAELISQLVVVGNDFVHAGELHGNSFRFHFVEVVQVVLCPKFCQALVIVNHSIDIHIIRPMARISEKMSNSGARNYLNASATAPNLHGQLHVVASPLSHPLIEESKLLEPVLSHGKNATRSSWTWICFWHVVLNQSTRIRVDQIKVPFVSPMSRRHGIILMPVFLRNLIQHWHRKHFGVHHHAVKNMLQPMLIGNYMCFKENNDRRSCHLNALHFGAHQTLSFLKCEHLHFRRQSFQLRFSRVFVPI
mmetsp:Transcript_81027/g.99271  ORF Transcript_81027/g.99271 Transcript_81027/m.99271 type:complete len:346 (-) Transcript_81027:314-1351(-)